MILPTKFNNLIIEVVNNKLFHFIGSRYITYLIQFLNSLFIAVYLGPYYLGVWGFITLIIQYLNQINLGIAHSVNATIAIHKNKNWYVEKVIGSSLTMLLGLCFVIALFFIGLELFDLSFGEKYGFTIYIPIVALIGMLGYFNSLFSNIFRVYGRLYEIAFNQTAFPVLMLVAILLFRGQNLLWALVLANCIAFFLSFILFVFRSPIKLKPQFIPRLMKRIQIKGWHLFVYSSAFYFIIISTRSFVSSYYTVEQFGYFTFAFALANVVQLLLQSFSFLIFPKFINRLASATNERIVSLLEMIRDVYITSSHLLIHLAILLIPVFLFFFPQYNQSEKAFKLIALTVVLYTNAFGYSGVLIAKNEERKLGHLSLLALAINIVLLLLFIEFVHPRFSYVVIATMLTYFVYVYLLSRLGRKKISLNTSMLAILKDCFSIRVFAPYLSSLIFIIFSFPNIFFVFPLVLFIGMNRKTLVDIVRFAKQIMVNPNIINI